MKKEFNSLGEEIREENKMTPSEESLSDKIELMDIERGDRYHPMVDVEDVKEFIKRLKKEAELDEIDCAIIDKLAGEKLK